MLYLNNEVWDKKEWEKLLLEHYNPKDRKKEFVFNLNPGKYMGWKKVDNKSVPTWPADFNYEMQYTINLNGEDVTVRYATTPSRMSNVQKGKKDGKTFSSQEVTHDMGKIVFDNGVFRVPAKQLDLYFFLMFSPNNETNPTYYRYDSHNKLVKDTDKWPQYPNWIFREKNDELEQAEAYDGAAALFEAQTYIHNGMSTKEAQDLYVLHEGGDRAEAELTPIKTIKNFLLGKASQNPQKFLDELDGEIRTLKQKITEAKEAKVIHFDFRTGWWKWTGEANGKICQVAKGQDENSVLLRYINQKDSGAILEALEGKIIAAEQEVEGDVAVEAKIKTPAAKPVEKKKGGRGYKFEESPNPEEN